MVFTTIIHAVRRRLGITCNEYCVVDTVCFKMNDPKSRQPGWCSLSRQELADELDFSKRTIQNMVSDLKASGLLEENDFYYLRTTPLWFEALSEEREKKKTGKGGGEEVAPRGEEVAPPVQKLHPEPPETEQKGGEEVAPPPVQTLHPPLYIKEIKLNNPDSLSVQAGKENFSNENDLPVWALKEKEETRKRAAELLKKNPPPVPDSPSLTWENLKEVLLADTFFVNWACKELKYTREGELPALIEVYRGYMQATHEALDPDDVRKHIISYGRSKIKNGIDILTNEAIHQSSNAKNGNGKTFRPNPQNSGPTAIIPRNKRF